MWDALFNQLERYATWKVIVPLVILFGICTVCFQIRSSRLGGVITLDSRRWYTPEEARDFFQTIGERGRKLYGWTQLSLDIVYPLTYGTLFALLIICGFPREDAKLLFILPLLTMLFDLGENVINAYLALQFDGRASPLSRVATVFTFAKRYLLITSMALSLLSLLGIIALVWRHFKQRE
jgi:hypothetical protein